MGLIALVHSQEQLKQTSSTSYENSVTRFRSRLKIKPDHLQEQRRLIIRSTDFYFFVISCEISVNKHLGEPSRNIVEIFQCNFKGKHGRHSSALGFSSLRILSG